MKRRQNDGSEPYPSCEGRIPRLRPQSWIEDLNQNSTCRDGTDRINTGDFWVARPVGTGEQWFMG